MKKIELRRATKAQLNYLVAAIEGKDYAQDGTCYARDGRLYAQGLCQPDGPNYVTEPALTYQIVRREHIGCWWSDAMEEEDGTPLREAAWYAEDADGAHGQTGDTPLFAAVRCYIASVLGETVDVPEELV